MTGLSTQSLGLFTQSFLHLRGALPESPGVSALLAHTHFLFPILGTHARRWSLFLLTPETPWVLNSPSIHCPFPFNKLLASKMFLDLE